MDRKNEIIRITISEDRMEARISIQEKGQRFPSKEAILERIKRKGVEFGVDDILVDRIASERKAVESMVFARGKPPRRGEDARLLPCIEIDYSQRPTITERGKADFKQLKLFEPVEKGQVLVCKLPATDGEAGKTVMGETIVLHGKEIELPAGLNTTSSEDGLTLYSTIEGYAFWDSGKLHVDNVYRIRGDVDYSTGNIRFDGSVVIEGDVRSGFRVEATDSVIVGGNVEGATIYSQNSDIDIRLGVLGKGKAKILAGRNLRCGFVQDATIGVKKDVTVEHYAINSGISSGGRVLLKNHEGLIRGGNIFAEEGIEAVEIGSSQDILTEVRIGGSKFFEGDSARWKLRRERERIVSRLSSLSRRAEFITLMEERLPDLSRGKREELAFIEKQTEELRQQIEELESQEKALLSSWDSPSDTKEIRVTGVLHRDVRIGIGDVEYQTERPLRGVRICRVGDRVFIESLPPSESSPYHVLIVDEDESEANSLTEFLHDQGYEVTGLTNAMTAFELLSKRPFDIVVASLRMPGVGGSQIVQTIKMNGPDTAIIVLLDQGHFDSDIDTVKWGISGCVTRPVHLSEIGNVVRTSVDNLRKMRPSKEVN